MAQGGGESVAPPAFLFCSFAGCVSSIPSHFLLGRHQRLTFDLFGRRERLSLYRAVKLGVADPMSFSLKCPLSPCSRLTCRT
jgi:hypothetical protein